LYPFRGTVGSNPTPSARCSAQSPDLKKFSFPRASGPYAGLTARQRNAGFHGSGGLSLRPLSCLQISCLPKAGWPGLEAQADAERRGETQGQDTGAMVAAMTRRSGPLRRHAQPGCSQLELRRGDIRVTFITSVFPVCLRPLQGIRPQGQGQCGGWSNRRHRLARLRK
jgi:hypothetical protein